MSALSRFVLWDYQRTSWQYDVMVALILLFIFVTPKDVFRDQPKAMSVVMLPADQGFWIEPTLLTGVPPGELISKASSLVNAKYKTRTPVLRVEPIFDDAEREVKGYMAFTKP
jgi:hypothetical protein